MTIYRILTKGIKIIASLFLSLFFILSIAFFIKSEHAAFPDEQNEMGFADLSSPTSKRTQTVKYGKKQQFDIPSFYFSVRPPHYPSLIHPILPLREREAFKGLLKDRIPGELLLTWRNQIVERLNTSELGQSRILINLLLSSSRKELEKNISLAKEKQLALPTITDSLTSRKASLGLPRFYWHGTQNQWHLTAKNFLIGDWGQSEIDGQAVSDKIFSALPYTMILNGCAIIILFFTALGMGSWWARSKNTLWVKLSRQIAYLLYVMPLFWLAALAIAFLTAPSGIFPLHSGIETHLDFSHFLLPLLCIWLSSFGYLSRMFEDSLKSEWQKPYIKLAKHRGLPNKWILFHYALPNAIIPIITLLGAAFPALVSGSLVIEVLFNIPGMGRLIWGALQENDWPVVFNIILIIGVFAWVGRWGADLLSQYLDPRINWIEK